MTRSIVVLAVFIGAGLSAAEDASAPWTLERCLHWGLAHHPSVTAIQAQIDEALANKEGALATLYPKLTWMNTLTGQQSSFGSASALFAAAPRGTLNPSFFSEWVFGASLAFQQSVFPWDRALDGARALDWTAEALRAARAQVELDLAFHIVKAFTGVLLTDHLVLIAHEGLAVAAESERTTQGLFKEGRASELDVAKAKVQRLNAAASALEAEGQARLARESLALLVSAPESFTVTGTLDVVPLEGEASAWESRALAERPDRTRLRAQQAAAQAGVDLMEKAGWPTVGVSAGYAWLNDRPGFNAGEWYKTWNVGVNLAWPLFDGGGMASQVKSARAKEVQAQAAASLLDTQVRLDVRQAWIQWASAKDRLATREEQVKVAEENWRITRDRYRLGLVSWLEVKEVELALTGARTQLAQTRADYLIGRAALERAAGVRPSWTGGGK